MTKSDQKPKLDIPTRKAKPKGNMFANLRRPEQVETVPFEELVGLPEATLTRDTPSTDQSLTNQTLTSQQPIAPQRNFARVPNSIALEAIPSGLFRGESKKLYDALYQRTRGAIVPTRIIRATRQDIMKWADISHNTLKSHVRYLTDAGLLKVYYRRGDRDGKDYEIFIPGEATLTNHSPTTHQTHTKQTQSTDQNLDTHTNQNLVLVGECQPTDYQTVDSSAKTSFKTNTKIDDDAALAFALFRSFAAKVKESTGRELSAADIFNLENVSDTLGVEFERAAARTDVVNNPAAFFATHLRRRLFRKERVSPEADGQEPRPLMEELPTESIPLEEHVEMFAGLVRDGEYTLEKLRAQFSGGFTADEWERIETGIETRLREKGSEALTSRENAL
jgi:hypothetical protein